MLSSTDNTLCQEIPRHCFSFQHLTLMWYHGKSSELAGSGTGTYPSSAYFMVQASHFCSLDFSFPTAKWRGWMKGSWDPFQFRETFIAYSVQGKPGLQQCRDEGGRSHGQGAQNFVEMALQCYNSVFGIFHLQKAFHLKQTQLTSPHEATREGKGNGNLLGTSWILAS